MPYADPEKQKQAKRESAARRRAAAKQLADGSTGRTGSMAGSTSKGEPVVELPAPRVELPDVEPTDGKLTPRQERFIAEYIINNGNARAAAIVAGYSPDSAEVTGCRLLMQDKIQNAVKAARQRTVARLDCTRERIALEYLRLALSDARNTMKWGPDGVILRDSSELTDDEAAAVAEVSQTITKDGGTIRLKLHSKRDALDSFCKMMGLNAPDKVEHSGSIDMTAARQLILTWAQGKVRPAGTMPLLPSDEVAAEPAVAVISESEPLPVPPPAPPPEPEPVPVPAPAQVSQDWQRTPEHFEMLADWRRQNRGRWWLVTVSPAEIFVQSSPEEQNALLDALSSALTPVQLAALPYTWRDWNARPEQLSPPGDWTVWLLQAGRGFGKTRSASEWIREEVEAGRARRIALVSDTVADTRNVMIQGPAGLLNIGLSGSRPKWKPSECSLTWPNGAVAYTYSAEAPELLRGPEHDLAWCDELAKWKNLRKQDRDGGTAWDNLMMGLRIGKHPRVCVSTTPRNIPLIRELAADPATVVTHGSTYDNAANLAGPFLSYVCRRYEGTRLGRQELRGQILDDNPDALWNRAKLDALRVHKIPCGLTRIALAIDPAASSSETAADTGIIAGALGEDGHAYITDDLTCHLSPAGWARAALNGYARLQAGTIVAEVNHGGEMVEHTLRSTCNQGEYFRYEAVRASQGKLIRAEPISALYAQGLVHHVGTFSELEDQLCTWVPGDDNHPTVSTRWCGC